MANPIPYRRPVYICAPYSGHSKDPAVRRAEVAANVSKATALAVLAIRSDLCPVLPHAHAAAYIEAGHDHAEIERYAMACGLNQIRMVRAVGGALWVLSTPDGGLSRGCQDEVRLFHQDGARNQPGTVIDECWADWRPLFRSAALDALWVRAGTPGTVLGIRDVTP